MDLPLAVDCVIEAEPREENFCLTIKQSYLRNICYKELAKNTLNSSYCEKIEGFPKYDDNLEGEYKCFYTVALRTDNRELCSKTGSFESMCYNFVS